MRWTTAALFCLAIAGAGGLSLWLMGRPVICTCGSLKLWHGNVFSAENSQHLTDWYTFTHFSHGLLFYFLLWLVCRATGLAFRVAPMLVLAVALETAWEVIENTNFVIDRYRQSTIALDYYGDSVVNSLSDIGTMALGFLAASWLPVWGSVIIAMALELVLLLIIRDNLALNLLMLIHPVEAIRNWQKI